MMQKVVSVMSRTLIANILTVVMDSYAWESVATVLQIRILDENGPGDHCA